MKISRYWIPIALFVFIIISNLILFYIRDLVLIDLGMTEAALYDLSYILPFSGNLEFIFAFLVLWPLMAIIGGVIGVFLSPGLIWIHKIIFGRKVSYGIEDVYKSDKYKRTFRGFFPSLMAINFSMLLSDYQVIQDLFYTGAPGTDVILAQTITFVAGITFTLIIGFALFSGLWAVSDAGIVFTNKKGVEKKKKEQPIVGQSIGNWYNYLLKGYAGIGVIIVYYELVSLYISMAAGIHPYILFINLWIFLGYIIILPIITTPATIILDVFRDKIVEFTRKFAAKLGIVEKVEIEFIKIDR